MISAFKVWRSSVNSSLVIVSILSIALSGCERGPSEAATDDRKREGLYGAVKSVRVETSKLVKQAREYSEGPRNIVKTNSFDAKGNIVEERYSSADGNLLYKIEYSYDASGRKSEGSVLDPKGNLRQRRVYTYDDKGSLNEQANYNADGGLHSKSVYSYDDKGKLTEWIVFNAKGALIDNWVYDYDDRGNRSAETRYFADGSVDTKHVYALDENGNRIESSRYDGEGKLKEKERYSYEFAPTGNWIKRTTLKTVENPGSEGFEPVEVTYREISYF